MAFEIERRFIVKGEDWRKSFYLQEEFLQGYLISTPEEWSVRVRIINQFKSFLTLKRSFEGFTNYEFEYQIPLNDGISMMNLSKHKINKTRYTLNYNKLEWVIDCFHGKNSSLILAEVELSSVNEKIQIPPWCHIEISGIKTCSNASLARKPITEWPIEERIKTKP